MCSRCTVYLSAIGCISRILFPSQKKPVARGNRLRERLRLTDLPNLSSRKVRNSFEHTNEKIDSLAAKTELETVVAVDIGQDQSELGEIVLKSFMKPQSVLFANSQAGRGLLPARARRIAVLFGQTVDVSGTLEAALILETIWIHVDHRIGSDPTSP